MQELARAEAEALRVGSVWVNVAYSNSLSFLELSSAEQEAYKKLVQEFLCQK